MYKAVKAGIDNISALSVLKEGRLGVLTAPTGVNGDLKPTYEVLAEKFNVTSLFAPEHGIRGDIQAGEHVSTYIDSETGLTVYSLYGEHKYMTDEMLDTFDILVFDIQDVGARYYTYIYSLTRSMKLCTEKGKKVVVLDRPNPVGGFIMEGITLNENFSSGVGEYAIPARYALTVGEFATYINKEKNMNCDLTVVPCEGWKRDMYFEQTGMPLILPSPNLPTVNAFINYFATCYFEGTNISEGRGTTIPFEIVGAPFIDGKKLADTLNAKKLPGVVFRSAYFTPTFSKHKGERCGGVQLHILDRDIYRPFDAGMYLLDEIRKCEGFEFIGGGNFEAKLFGDDSILKDDFSVEACLTRASKDCAEFRAKVESVLMYE